MPHLMLQWLCFHFGSFNSSFVKRVKPTLVLFFADIEKQLADEAIFLGFLQVYNMSLAK